MAAPQGFNDDSATFMMAVGECLLKAGEVAPEVIEKALKLLNAAYYDGQGGMKFVEDFLYARNWENQAVKVAHMHAALSMLCRETGKADCVFWEQTGCAPPTHELRKLLLVAFICGASPPVTDLIDQNTLMAKSIHFLQLGVTVEVLWMPYSFLVVTSNVPCVNIVYRIWTEVCFDY